MVQYTITIIIPIGDIYYISVESPLKNASSTWYKGTIALMSSLLKQR